MEIKELIRKIVKQEVDEMEIHLAQVNSVEDDRTCSVMLLDNDTEYSGVRLQAKEDASNGIFLQPAVGSIVMVVLDKIPFVVMTSAVDYVEIRGDQYGGLTKTPTLRDELNKTRSLLNAVIQVINGTPIPEPGSGSASALQAALKVAITGQSLGSYDEIENEMIKHG